jgi:hypothetical protein
MIQYLHIVTIPDQCAKDIRAGNASRLSGSTTEYMAAAQRTCGTQNQACPPL